MLATFTQHLLLSTVIF